MNKRVLHIIGRSSYDGTFIYALRLAENLQHYSSDFLIKEKGKAAEEIMNSGFHIYHLDCDGNKKIWILRNAVRYLFRNKYDVIHYQSGGTLLLLLAWLFRKEAVLIHHIHCGNITGSPLEKKVQLLNRLIYRYLNSRIFKVAVSQNVYEFYSRNIGSSDKLFIIKNTVPFDFLKKSTLCNKIGYIGQISKDKGFDEILRVFGNEQEYELIIKGDNYYNKNLLHYNNCITFRKPSMEIIGFFREIDLLLFPSEAVYEGMPLVILEAVASDTGVIAMKTESVCEILGRDYPLYVESFSKEEVFNKLFEYYSGKINRVQLSELHYRISKSHSFMKMKKDIEKLYSGNIPGSGIQNSEDGRIKTCNEDMTPG